MKDLYDVAVIGGGLAGGLAAYHLAKSGMRILLIEKESRAHQKVCGEFISGECFPLLSEAGLDLRSLGAVPIRRFRLHGPRHTLEAGLPIAALGLSRFVLDEELLKRAIEVGAKVKRGALVREVTRDQSVFEMKLNDETCRARRLIVATGKHDLRSVQRRQGQDSGFVGFKMHLSLQPEAHRALKDHCDLFVFNNGYGGFAPIENGLFNFCFLLAKERVLEVGSDWKSMMNYISQSNAQAAKYLLGAEPKFSRFTTVASVPYGFVRDEGVEEDVYCVGDQLAVIPSLTGDGMSIALQTGRAAAFALMKNQTSKAYHREMTRGLKPQVQLGFYMHQLFKYPNVCDGAALLARALPSVLKLFFARTRCQIDKHSTSVAL